MIAIRRAVAADLPFIAGVMTRQRSGRRQDDTGVAPNGGATIGHEAELWAMADALRGSMDAAEYKQVALGLIFLKYISDAFEERRAKVLAEFGEDAAEDRDEYTAENIFWVPPEARWAHLRAQARQSTNGLSVDQAMAAVEHDNPALKDVLPRDYARPALNKRRLGQLIDLVSNIQVGDQDARSRDVLGRVYEYFAWVQHMVHHLAPAGVAGFVLANGSMSSSQSGEGTIRKNLVEADGAEPQPDDGEPFEAKMKRLVAELQARQAEGARLDAAIAENLKAIGFPLRGHGS